MDKETRRSTLRIIRYTLSHAPFMLRRVFGFIGMEYSRRVMLQSVRHALRRRIQIEKSEDFTLEIDQEKISIPDNFKISFREILPQIHEHVYLGLTDKILTEEALVKIFGDFIIRCGQSAYPFSEQHREFLRELTDSTIAKLNEAAKGGSSNLTHSAVHIQHIKSTGFAEDILKALEQEMRNSGETTGTV